MLLIPYKKFTLKISQPLAEVEEELAARVQRRRIIRNPFKVDLAIPFEGVVENGRFNINRRIIYDNPFLPRMVGKLDDELGATIVNIDMRLNYFGLGFTVLLMLFWLMVIETVFGSEYLHFLVELWSLPGFLFSMVLLYMVIMALFNWEAEEAVQLLEDVWGEKLEI